MLYLVNEEIIRLIVKQGNLVWIATVDSKCIPNISPRFVLGILEGNDLLFADAFGNKTFNNIISCPIVAVAILDIDNLGGYQLKGKVEEVTDPQLFSKAGAKLKEFGIDAKPAKVWKFSAKEVYSLVPSRKSKKPIVSLYS